MTAAAKTIPMYAVNGNNTASNDVQENYDNDRGFVGLFRSVRKHWIWQDAVKFKWWVDILLEVNYKPEKVLIGGKLLLCERGQSLNSLQTWAKRWRTDVSSVRRFFNLLKGDGMIKTENAFKTTRLTVCNYESYQDFRHADDTDLTRVRHGLDTHSTTNNNDNNSNNVNKDNNIDSVEKNTVTRQRRRKQPQDTAPPALPFSSEAFAAKWAEWMSYREVIRKKYRTAAGIKGAIDDLIAISGPDEDMAIQLIDQSLKKEWQTFYPLKNNQPQNNATHQQANNKGNRSTGGDAGAGKSAGALLLASMLRTEIDGTTGG